VSAGMFSSEWKKNYTDSIFRDVAKSVQQGSSMESHTTSGIVNIHYACGFVEKHQMINHYVSNDIVPRLQIITVYADEVDDGLRQYIVQGTVCETVIVFPDLHRWVLVRMHFLPDDGDGSGTVRESREEVKAVVQDRKVYTFEQYALDNAFSSESVPGLYIQFWKGINHDASTALFTSADVLHFLVCRQVMNEIGGYVSSLSDWSWLPTLAEIITPDGIMVMSATKTMIVYDGAKECQSMVMLCKQESLCSSQHGFVTEPVFTQALLTMLQLTGELVLVFPEWRSYLQLNRRTATGRVVLEYRSLSKPIALQETKGLSFDLSGLSESFSNHGRCFEELVGSLL